MESLSRRAFIGGLAAASASTLIPQAQNRAGKINIHHHLTAPAYVKFLTDNKVRDFPNKSVAEGIEDMDKAGISTAFTSIIGPGIWFGNIEDTRRLARESQRLWRKTHTRTILAGSDCLHRCRCRISTVA